MTGGSGHAGSRGIGAISRHLRNEVEGSPLEDDCDLRKPILSSTFQSFYAAENLRLIDLPSLVEDVEHMQRSRHEAESNLVPRMPLEDRSAEAHPAIESFSTDVECPIEPGAFRADFGEQVYAALSEIGRTEPHVRLDRILMHGLPGFFTQILSSRPFPTD